MTAGSIVPDTLRPDRTGELAPEVARGRTSRGEPPTTRIGWIDGARGLSIGAMIVSHVGYFTGVTPDWFHLYVMRPVAPVFLLLVGMMWRPGFRRRHVQLGVGLVVAQLLSLALPFGSLPDVLALIGLCLLLLPITTRFPHATLALCVTQLAFWPIPGWTGYPLGFAVALTTAGAVIPADGFVRAYGKLGSWLGLESVGRRPMTWYVGHLLVLVVLAMILRANI